MNIQFSVPSLVLSGSIILLSLSSCGDIEQNLIVNSDGSGSLETTFDVGEMMSMVKGFGDAAAEDVTVSMGEVPDTTVAEEEKDPMQAIIDKVTDPEYDREFDTLISFLSIMPDSVKEKEEKKNLKLAKKLSLRMKSPANSADLTIGLLMDFDDPEQLRELGKYVESLDEASSSSVLSSASPGGLQAENFLVFEADMKAGWIRLDTVDYSAMAAEFGMSSDSLMSSEDLGMMEMMFGSTKIKSVIHVPGEVISCTNPDAILTKDNKVISEHGFMDVIKAGRIDGYTIYFTPKK